MMLEQWASDGCGQRAQRLDVMPQVQSKVDPPSGVFGVDGDDDGEAVTPATQARSRTRRRDWHQPDEALDGAHEDAVPPVDPTAVITLEMQMQDPQLRILIETIRGTRKSARAQRRRAMDKYELNDTGLHRIILKDGEAGLALAVPKIARAAVLSRFHHSLADGGGHVGGQTMYDQIRPLYYWNDLERECHEFAAACEVCGGTRSQGTIGAEQRSSPTPGAPFEVVHLDHKGPLTKSGGFCHVLVVVCALTRFTLFIPVVDTKATTTLEALRDHVFSIFGYPLVIINDNGSAFANKLMNASQQLYGYRQVFVMPHTPQANGLAESAVKKLKLILDRHTLQYQGWHHLLGMAQAAVNQRVSSGTMESPFVAVFGRQPITLTALENPSLLPTNSPEAKDVRQLAFTMSRLHRRLQGESEAIKEVATLNANMSKLPKRLVQKGDKIWLTYSDSERARYLRKHGHGLAFRHPFVVEAVKPHAVKLVVPKDGSVPDVLPWQSLRKCAFAAPHFHRDDLPVPAIDESTTPLVPDRDARLSPPADPSNTPSLDGVVDPSHDETAGRRSGWTTENSGEVEKIVSVEHIGSGWRLHVKWKGYDETTPEPCSTITKYVTDPDILEQISRLQEEYLANHPKVTSTRRAEVTLPPATRVLPSRDRDEPKRFMYIVEPLSTEPFESGLISPGLRAIRRALEQSISALAMVTSCDFANEFAHVMPVIESNRQLTALERGHTRARPDQEDGDAVPTQLGNDEYHPPVEMFAGGNGDDRAEREQQQGTAEWWDTYFYPGAPVWVLAYPFSSANDPLWCDSANDPSRRARQAETSLARARFCPARVLHCLPPGVSGQSVDDQWWVWVRGDGSVSLADARGCQTFVSAAMNVHWLQPRQEGDTVEWRPLWTVDGPLPIAAPESRPPSSPDYSPTSPSHADQAQATLPSWWADASHRLSVR
jgi:hypothetical protein